MTRQGSQDGQSRGDRAAAEKCLKFVHLIDIFPELFLKTKRFSVFGLPSCKSGGLML
jgi:hypothetical protein